MPIRVVAIALHSFPSLEHTFATSNVLEWGGSNRPVDRCVLKSPRNNIPWPLQVTTAAPRMKQHGWQHLCTEYALERASKNWALSRECSSFIILLYICLAYCCHYIHLRRLWMFIEHGKDPKHVEVEPRSYIQIARLHWVNFNGFTVLSYTL